MAQLVGNIAGLAISSVGTVNDLAVASAGTIAGLDNTSGGGPPTGNAFTIVSYVGESNTSAPNGPAGAVGDTIIVFLKWEGDGVISGISASTSGAFTLRGSTVTHANNDIRCRFATVTTSAAGAEIITPSFSSGTASFRDWAIWRVSASGTRDFTIINGGTGTGAPVSTGSITSTCNNGLSLVGLGLYDAATPTSQQVAGNAASNIRAMGGSSSQAWDYTHTSQINGAGTCSSVSIEWVTQILDCSAQ